jgi:hypothetical protein
MLVSSGRLIGSSGARIAIAGEDVYDHDVHNGHGTCLRRRVFERHQLQSLTHIEIYFLTQICSLISHAF